MATTSSMQENYDTKTKDMPENWMAGMKNGGNSWYKNIAKVLGVDEATVRNSVPGKNWSSFMNDLSKRKEHYSTGISGKGAKLVEEWKKKFGVA